MQKTFLFTYLVRSQRLNVHLLGLSLERFFVGPHRLHDGAVVEEDQDHWQEVVKEDNKEKEEKDKKDNDNKEKEEKDMGTKEKGEKVKGKEHEDGKDKSDKGEKDKETESKGTQLK